MRTTRLLVGVVCLLGGMTLSYASGAVHAIDPVGGYLTLVAACSSVLLGALLVRRASHG